MNVLRKCPGCNTSNMKSSISLKHGRYVQKIDCLDCPYHNNRDAGDADSNEHIEDPVDEE